MYSYEGLIDILTAKGFTKTDLTRDLGISSRTIAKIGKGEKIAQNTLQKIADYLVPNRFRQSNLTAAAG